MANQLLEEEDKLRNITSADYLTILSELSGAGDVAKANIFRDLTGRQGAFSFGASGLGSSLKSAMALRDDEILSELISKQRQAIANEELPLNDIRAWNTWFKDYPQQFAKSVREAYESMSGQRATEIKADQTKKTFDQAQIDRTTEAAYEATGEEANALLNRIKDQYTTLKPGRQQLGKAQAIDQLTSGLIELGIKGKDLSSYTARLESVIKLTEEMRAGTVNKTAGRYATEIIKGLEDETYNYVQAMAKFNEWTAGLDPSSAGVKAARTALTDHISAMKYTQENVAVALADGRLDFVTKKELEQAPDGTFFPPATHRAIPPAMALVAFMVGEEEGVEPLPIEFIRKVIQSGFSAIATLEAAEQAHWNAWVKKYKEKNPDLLAAIVAQFAAGGTPPDSAVTINR